MTTRPPLGSPSLWQAVIDRAEARCQCSGACGKTHAKSGGRCEHTQGGWLGKHGGTVRLLAAPTAPADMLLLAHESAALPAARLAAWCGPCFDHARTAARRKAPPAELDALFDI
ncbi:hypothetical protein [Kitasatospora phosalacinea]|uniref:hypothetical protein n=1 Tax=Kitasatospora phosalacinea TaxID=2065 RepID=UPI0005247529|nr:hypothetical protein [Kitasatospora phosalacinea]